MTAAHGVIVYKTDHVISDLSVSSFSLFVAQLQVVCPRVGTIFDNALRGSPKFRTVGKNLGWAVLLCGLCGVKLKFHWTDTDTDTDILVDFRARILAQLSTDLSDTRAFPRENVRLGCARVHV